MAKYQPAVQNLDRAQLFELLVRVKHMRNAMFAVLDFVDREHIGMSEEFCNKYPFHQSFDELFCEVMLWEDEIERKHEESK